MPPDPNPETPVSEDIDAPSETDPSRAVMERREEMNPKHTPREAVARAICKSGRFESGQGTCAVLCMDQLGDVRKKGCGHAERVHGKLADQILAALPAQPPADDAVRREEIMREIVAELVSARRLHGYVITGTAQMDKLLEAFLRADPLPTHPGADHG